MHRASAILLAAMLAACPRPRAVPAASGPTVTEVPLGVPFVAPGESMTYEVSLHGVTLATFTIVIGSVSPWHGHQAVAVQATANASGLAAMVKQVSAEFVTWLDVKTGRPLVFRVTESRGEDEAVERSEARFLEITPGILPIVTVGPGTGEVVERQVITQQPIDMLTFLISARAWDAPNGSRRNLEVVRSRYMWKSHATIVGRTKLTTELGSLPAIEIAAETTRLNRDGSLDKSIPRRDLRLWISDDADRVPLLLTTESDYGDIKLEIVDYTAGTSANLTDP